MNRLQRSVIFLASITLMSGCATPQSQTPIAEAPTCSAQADCDLKWAVARSFVLSHSGFKFQTYTSDFMETFNPTGGAVQLGARVNREPQPNGTFKIAAAFWCDNVFGCVPNARETLDQFNRTVAGAPAAKP